MTLPPAQQVSVEAYLKLLEASGADALDLARRRALLEMLLPCLPEQPVPGAGFRLATDAATAQVAKNEWP